MAMGYERAFVMQVLSSLTTFEGCSAEDLQLLADAVEGRSLIKTGDPLCTEGDDADRWWVVISGQAQVVANNTPVGTIGKYETIGELALFDDQPRSATIIAKEELDVLAFDKANFVDVIRSSPALAITLLKSAARRLRETNALV
jgi:CRP/FNR family cyclic AMP-dependent transcriptional regulator